MGSVGKWVWWGSWGWLAEPAGAMGMDDWQVAIL